MRYFERLVLLLALVGCSDKDNEIEGVEECDSTVWYADIDGDGFGDFRTSKIACSRPDSHVEVGGDCDDQDASIPMPMKLVMVSTTTVMVLSMKIAHWMFRFGIWMPMVMASEMPQARYPVAMPLKDLLTIATIAMMVLPWSILRAPRFAMV